MAPHIQGRSSNPTSWALPSLASSLGSSPQTFADVIDTSQLSHQTSAFALLGVDVVREIAQHALGIEADHKGYHRFRVRRDGTVSVGFLGFGADNWRVDELLLECLQLVAVARALWNDFGVRQPSTLSIRVRMTQDRMASSGMVRSSRLTPLPYKLDIDLPIDIADVLGSPLSIARRALDRLYNAMGQARAPHFEQDGSLRADLVKHFAPPLLAALRSS